MSHGVTVPLVALLLAGCDAPSHPTRPLEPATPAPAPSLSLETPEERVQVLAPRTLVRETGRPETIHLPIEEVDFSRVMEPFVLRIRAEGATAESPMIGWVWVDDIEVLGPQQLAQGGVFDLEIPLGPASAVSLQLVGPPGSRLTASIDAAPQPPPTIVVTSPARAAMLMQGTEGPSPVTVTGEACHPVFPITSLEVAGQPVPVAGDRLCEPFEVVQESGWGLSVVTARATNARGRVGTVAQSYLRSPAYFPAAHGSDPAARAPTGALGRLPQGLLDDGDRGDADDLATFLQASLGPHSLDAALPNPILEELTPTRHYDCFLYSLDNWRSGFRVTKRAPVANRASRIAALTTHDGELRVTSALEGVQAPVTVLGAQDLGCLGNPNASVSGTWAGSTSADAGMWVSATATGPQVVRAWTTVESSSTFSIDLGVFSFMSPLVDGMVNGVIGLLEHELEDAISDEIENEMPVRLEDLFSRYTVAGDATVNGVPLRSESVVDVLEAKTGTLDLGLATQVRPASPPAAPPAAAFGPIRSGAAAPALPAAAYATGVGDDLVNQLLWAAWQGGAFRLADVGAYSGAGSGSLAASLEALLPPVVMPGGAQDALRAGFGDVRLQGTFDPAAFSLAGASVPADPVAFVAHASFTGAATLAYDGGSARLAASWLGGAVSVDLGALPSFVDREILEAAVAERVEAAVLGLLAEAIAAVPLPRMDLSGFGGLPPTFLRLPAATVERAGSYTLLTGTPE